MSCCPHAAAQLTERHRVKVRYGGGRPVVVKGPATSIDYRFSGLERLQLVDPRDAIAIVKNPLFQIVGVTELSQTGVTPAKGA
jgi:hypothetical protein